MKYFQFAGGSATSRTDQPSPDRLSAKSSARQSGSPKKSSATVPRSSAGYQQQNLAGNGDCGTEITEGVTEIDEGITETDQKGQEVLDREVSDSYCPDQNGNDHQSLIDKTPSRNGASSKCAGSNTAVNGTDTAVNVNNGVNDDLRTPQQNRSTELLTKPARSRSRTASSEITTTSAVSGIHLSTNHTLMYECCNHGCTPEKQGLI